MRSWGSSAPSTSGPWRSTSPFRCTLCRGKYALGQGGGFCCRSSAMCVCFLASSRLLDQLQGSLVTNSVKESLDFKHQKCMPVLLLLRYVCSIIKKESPYCFRATCSNWFHRALEFVMLSEFQVRSFFQIFLHQKLKHFLSRCAYSMTWPACIYGWAWGGPWANPWPTLFIKILYCESRIGP